MAIQELLSQPHGNITISVTPADLKEFGLALMEEARREAEARRAEVKWLTTDEACAEFGVTGATLWRWVNKGIIKPIKMGKFTRYSSADVARVKNGGREL